MEDQEFIRGKVPMTKEEVRAVSLAKLGLYKAKTFLDIGAGTGSISIEAALSYPDLQVTAVEEKEEALDLIQANREKFKLENLEIKPGHAPIALSGPFDCIFIGGSGGSLEEVLDWSYDLLGPGGRMVLNFILLENAKKTQTWAKDRGLAWQVRSLSVNRLRKLGKGHYWKPENPIIIMKLVKDE